MIPRTILHKLLDQLIVQKSLVRIVQVGANDGKINDPIYDLVCANLERTSILLIEPQPDIIEFLYSNYKHHPGAHVWNGAIGPEGHLDLYRVRPEYWESYRRTYLQDAPSYRVPSGFASTSLSHVINHAQGNLPDGVDTTMAIEQLKVACCGLAKVVDSYFPEFNRFDVLQIDTEGMDHVVLEHSAIERFRPILINFEHAHLSPDIYRSTGERLIRLGYRLIRWSKDDTLAIAQSVLRKTQSGQGPTKAQP